MSCAVLRDSKYLDLDAEHTGRRLRSPPLCRVSRMLRLRNDGDALRCRDDLLHQLDALAHQVEREEGDARHVAAGARQALHQACRHRPPRQCTAAVV
jgi:hypothetical protein